MLEEKTITLTNELLLSNIFSVCMHNRHDHTSTKIKQQIKAYQACIPFLGPPSIPHLVSVRTDSSWRLA